MMGGEYTYYSNTNKLEKVADGMGGNSTEKRDMSADNNFVYDSEGNLIEDRSKNLKISYDWRGMPVEFRMETRAGNVLENTRSCSRDSVRVLMAYDGSGRRVSKTRFRKACISETSTGATSERTYAADWERELVTHYTGIGTEVRENYRNNALENAKVVVNMPNGLGRYMPEDASAPVVPSTTLDENGKPTDWSVFNPKFEWYLKNHLGSTMLVYGTQSTSNADVADLGEVKKAYDYRSFGEQIDLIADAGDKVTENFTGKEKDDETELNYFGARYLDPMLGLWISVDPARQFSSPYLYVGNGMNPISSIDPDGNAALVGAALGVAGGMAFAFAESYRSNQPFHYSLADCITDAAVGALGFGAIKNFGKAASALSNMEKIKTAGKSLRRPRWKNEFNAAKKELEEGAIKLGVGQLVDKTAPQIMEDFAPGMKEYSIDFEIPESIKIDQMMPEPIVQNETKLEEDVK